MHMSTLSLFPLLLTGAAHASPVLTGNYTANDLNSRNIMSTDGTLYCGIFATGSRDTASGLLTDLDAGANGKISDKSYTIGSGECNRITCWETTGVYVCNDAADPIILKGNDVWLAANHVYKNCCYDVSGYSGLNAYQGLSGQKFVKSGSTNYNAIISYANCKQPVDIRPGGAGGQGINQACSGGVTPGGS